MDNSESSLSSRIFPVILVLIGLILLYYLYQYLFSPSETAFTLSSGLKDATMDETKPISITSAGLPALYEGGEFTISSWIYITNWGYRAQHNKSILRIGGPQFDTIRIYLGGNKPKLYVRLHTKEPNTVTSVNAANESCDASTRDVLFQSLQMDSGMNDNSLCDLPEIELQKWVHITVAVNGKTVDVYLDGKLARSCVLPSYFKVDSAYSAYLLTHGGFGGKIASMMMYDTALNPDRIYHLFMAGPNPMNSFSEWLSSIFSFNVSLKLN
jgi:hypothetical protein